MKKKIIFCIIILVSIGVISLKLLANRASNDYTIKLIPIDEKSPDRKLLLYKKGKQIEFKEIKYLNNNILCKGSNPTIFYGDLKNKKQVIVVLKNDEEIKINVVNEEIN